MLSRFFKAVVLSCFLVLPATAQTVRFDTNVGNIDFTLNPTGNPNLQPNVDNILAYVNAGLYDASFINRAATGFVLQFGGFSLDPLAVPTSPNDFIDIPAFDPVIVDADNDGQVDFIFDVDGDDIPDPAAFGLSNTAGSVSLALSGAGPNSGTSSFFVNLGDNEFLDDQGFVPFATVQDTTTVDLISALPQVNLDPTGQNLAAINIPTINNANVVFIERAFVLEDEGSTSSYTFSTLTPAEAVSTSSVSTFSTVTEATDQSDDPVGTFSTLTAADEPTEAAVNTFSALSVDSDLPDAAVSTFSTVTLDSELAEAAASTFSTLTDTDLVDDGPITFSTLTINEDSADIALLSVGDSGVSGVQAVSVPEPPALVLAIGAFVAIYLLTPSKR